MIPGNADSLKECLERLSTDECLYQSLIVNGRRFVLEKFSRDVFAEDYLRVLSKLVPAVNDPAERTPVSASR